MQNRLKQHSELSRRPLYKFVLFAIQLICCRGFAHGAMHLKIAYISQLETFQVSVHLNSFSPNSQRGLACVFPPVVYQAKSSERSVPPEIK